MANPLYAIFFGPVKEGSAASFLKEVAKRIKEEPHDELHLLLSTPRGSVSESMAIYHMLRALPLKVITYNIGLVASDGNIIFLAGEERYAAPSASFQLNEAKIGSYIEHSGRKSI